jgi:histidine triad (HIT) family protein
MVDSPRRRLSNTGCDRRRPISPSGGVVVSQYSFRELDSNPYYKTILRAKSWEKSLPRREKGAAMAEDSLFLKIIRGEIPADIVFQDDRATAFRDINPQAPTHVLVVPNRLIPTVNDVSEGDEALVGHLFTVAAKVAAQEGIAEDGYRLIVNCNRHGGQEVFHLHVHVMGGRPMGPMVARK